MDEDGMGFGGGDEGGLFDADEFPAEAAEAEVDIVDEKDAAAGAGSGPSGVSAGAGSAGKGKAVDPSQRVTTRYMTKYERARLLGTRALQLRCVTFKRRMPFNALSRCSDSFSQFRLPVCPVTLQLQCAAHGGPTRRD